jgi:hypothetical protein
MSFSHIVHAAALCAAALLTVAARAATLTVTPQDAGVRVGEIIELTIVGEDFTAGAGGTIGGALSVSWDPSLIALTGYSTDVFAGDKFFAEDNTTVEKDAAAGTLSNLSVLSLTGLDTADFNVATLVFEGLQPGVSAIGLSIGYFDTGAENRWFDADGLVHSDPAFAGTTLAVTPVPLPAAAWFLVSGLVGLGLVGRRKQTT